MVGTARCAVRAAYSGATSAVVRSYCGIRSARCTRPGTSQRDAPTTEEWERPALFLCDAVEVLVGAEKDLPIRDRGRGVARFAQIIHGQDVALLRIGPKQIRQCDAFSGLMDLGDAYPGRRSALPWAITLSGFQPCAAVRATR